VIILSASLIALCPRKQIEAVIAHECAHIKLHHHTKKGMFHNAVDCIRILSTPKIGSHVNLKEVADFLNSASAITTCGELAGNQLQQHHEFQADKFSALVVDPISLIRFFQDFESTGDRALSFRWVWRRCRNPFTLLISECAADNMVTLPFYGFIKALDIVDAVTMIRLVFQCTEYSHYLILSAWRLSPLWISIVGHTLKSLFQPGRKVDLVSEFANDLSKSHPSMPRRISQLEKLKTFHISRTDVAVASIIFITLVAACSQYK
jgi:Zn-dependent protease with chaperone function